MILHRTEEFFSSQRLSLSFSGASQNPHIYFHLHPSPLPVFFSSLVWQFIFISILWLRCRQILFFHYAIFLSLPSEVTSKKLFLAAKSRFLCLRKKNHNSFTALCQSRVPLANLLLCYMGNFNGHKCPCSCSYRFSINFHSKIHGFS